MEDWKKRMKDRWKDKGSKGRFTLPEGDTTIRILPNVADREGSPLLEFLIHREVGAKNLLQRCGKDLMTGKGSCWLCDEKIPQLRASSSAAKRALAAKMEPVENMACQILVLNAEGKFEGPKVFYPSSGGQNSLAARIAAHVYKPSRQIYHPTKGRNLTITRTGKGKLDTRYPNVDLDDEPTEVPKELLAKAKPLEELINPYSAKNQKAAFLGVDSSALSDDDPPARGRRAVEDDDEEAPRKRRRPVDDDDDEEAPRKRRPVEDDEDDDTPRGRRPVADDDEDEDDEDEPPARKRHSVEDDDEDEDDEDDEDEPPARKRRPIEDEDEDEDDEDEDDEDEDEDEDDEDGDDGDDEDDEDEDDVPRGRRPKSKPAQRDSKKSSRAVDEDAVVERPSKAATKKTPAKKAAAKKTATKKKR